jgi:hypothetical protein
VNCHTIVNKQWPVYSHYFSVPTCFAYMYL